MSEWARPALDGGEQVGRQGHLPGCPSHRLRGAGPRADRGTGGGAARRRRGGVGGRAPRVGEVSAFGLSRTAGRGVTRLLRGRGVSGQDGVGDVDLASQPRQLHLFAL